MTQQYRLTGYTKDKQLKTDAKRLVDDPDTVYESESEVVIQAVRKFIGEIEAEEKAAEYNVERRLERKLDAIDRQVEQTTREVIREELDNTSNSGGGGDSSNAAQSASANQDEQSGLTERKDGGDWR